MSVAEALAFDMYGTLVDPIRIWKQLEKYIPDDAQRIAEIWRQKQLEFTFRLTAMERYEDFEQVTRKALDYALAATGHILSAGMQAAWVNRSGGLFDTLAAPPQMVVKTLAELADVLAPL
jgi:2-haloacid dehalogenase